MRQAERGETPHESVTVMLPWEDEPDTPRLDCNLADAIRWETYLAGKKYYFIALLVLLECTIPFFLIFESRKPQARELVTIAVLCAIALAGRAAFFMLP